MARTTHVKAYKGRRQCQHEPEFGERCGLTKGDPIHGSPDPGIARRGHKFDPGPPKVCERCGGEIRIGDPYKWVAPGGPRMQRRRERCGSCPGWKPSELTGSPYLHVLYAAGEDAPEVEISDDPEAVAESLKALAEHYGQAARECSEIRIEAADNIEDGFGHSTYQSEELREQGEAAEAVADELEDWEPSTSFEDAFEDDYDDDDEREQALLDALQEWADDQLQEIEDQWAEMP